jgi:hypothetical protein
MNNIVIGIDFAKETFDATILRVKKLSSKGQHEQFSNNPYPQFRPIAPAAYPL